MTTDPMEVLVMVVAVLDSLRVPYLVVDHSLVRYAERLDQPWTQISLIK